MIAKKKKVQKKKPAEKTVASRRPTSPRKIVLESIVRISNTQELKLLLSKFLNRRKVSIDASKLEKIDTSALQLLCAFVIEADKMSIGINWESPSSQLLNSSRLLGLSEILKLPSAPANKQAI